MRITSLAFLFLMVPAIAQESSWLTKLDDAKAAAKKDQKPILASFTGSDWCPACIKLKDDVFSKPEFAEWSKKVVLLEIDSPKKTPLPDELKKQNEQLKKQYGVTAFPTVLVLDAEGKKVGTLDNAEGVANWIKLADAQLEQKGKSSAASEGDWTTDFKAALAKAKKEKKIVLANFTGKVWCPYCIKLHDEVFAKPEFKEWAAEHFVLLELDYPRGTKLSEELTKQNDELAKEYHVEGFPTVLFLDPKGKKLGQSGYNEGGPGPWIAAAEKELGIKSKRKKGK